MPLSTSAGTQQSDTKRQHLLERLLDAVKQVSRCLFAKSFNIYSFQSLQELDFIRSMLFAIFKSHIVLNMKKPIQPKSVAFWLPFSSYIPCKPIHSRGSKSELLYVFESVELCVDALSGYWQNSERKSDTDRCGILWFPLFYTERMFMWWNRANMVLHLHYLTIWKLAIAKRYFFRPGWKDLDRGVSSIVYLQLTLFGLNKEKYIYFSTVYGNHTNNIKVTVEISQCFPNIP